MPIEVVVIDDDKVTSSLLKKFLSDLGFTVHTAFDGESGLQLTQNVKPALVICDMLLPKLHGADVCQKIKNNEELKKTKVVMITAIYKEILVKAEARQWGADLFLEKPVNTAELLKWINKNVIRQKPVETVTLEKINIESVNVDDVVNRLKKMVEH
ncbi:MAG: response regulator [Candidatus Aminicenantes bacterium]|nr:response regulator [Candidatus Aminicenantes bacterium]